MADSANIQEATRFWTDLRIDKRTRRTYCAPIRDKMREAGSRITGFTPADLENVKTVRELVDLVFANQSN